MTGWILLTTTLAGANLVRIWRHGLALAGVMLAALALIAWLGGIQVESWSAFTAALLGGGVAILLWWRAPRKSGWHLLALLALGSTAVLQLLTTKANGPAAAGVWPWLVALLLLADPTTRLLRWGMELMGKPYAAAVASHGRGEAIGILERWILLVVLARGEYAAMAFLMAAKALARHERFEKDPEFAEYFLLGTLASVLAATLVAEALVLLGAVPPRGV